MERVIANTKKETPGNPAAVVAAQQDGFNQRRRDHVIYVTYVIAALDVTWLFVQISVTPYLAKKLDFDTLWFGYLQTTVGVIQLLGGPIFGRFADLFGARAAMSLAHVASIVYFVLLAIADTPAMLFMHKLPVFFMHVLPASQMVVADLTEAEHRADALAKLGICFGIGMITGSTLGGTLNTKYGETCTAYVGAAGCTFGLLLVVMFIPKSTKVQAPSTSINRENSERNKSIFSLAEITRLLKFPGITRIFLIKIISGLPSVIFQVMFPIIMMDFFKLEPAQTGYLMAFFGIAQMVIQGLVIGRVTAKYSDGSLLLLAIGVSALVGLAQAAMQNVFHFCLIIIPMVFSLCLFNVISDSMLTNTVPSSDTGTMMGLCASVQSLLRTIAPTIGGLLYGKYGMPSFGLIQCAVNSILVVYLLQYGLKKQEPKHRE
ncbi:Solute carrier family 22 member 18 [Merluccius polli]|uniref:Organic cation transporter-like protein 2 n=1 Tax=Merluccius polli TaxID=89951 RepID=A0AA47NS54_MERPO|nr:Solute carrier family 22 member 18 [Merluccius polli]